MSSSHQVSLSHLNAPKRSQLSQTLQKPPKLSHALLNPTDPKLCPTLPYSPKTYQLFQTLPNSSNPFKTFQNPPTICQNSLKRKFLQNAREFPCTTTFKPFKTFKLAQTLVMVIEKMLQWSVNYWSCIPALVASVEPDIILKCLW